LVECFFILEVRSYEYLDFSVIGARGYQALGAGPIYTIHAAIVMIVILKEDLQFLNSLTLIVWRGRVVLKIQVLIIVLIIVYQVRETTDLQRF
jgi:hypothetical protein